MTTKTPRKNMNLAELAKLLEIIKESHSPCVSNSVGRVVKYVDPVIDMRTGQCFSIKFRMFGCEDAEFHTTNECRYTPDSLFDRCVAWLNENPHG